MNIFKVLGGVVSAIPLVKGLWYAVKKDVPRVTCPNCKGAGRVIVGGTVLNSPATTCTCPICKGEGKIRKTEVPKELKP